MCFQACKLQQCWVPVCQILVFTSRFCFVYMYVHACGRVDVHVFLGSPIRGMKKLNRTEMLFFCIHGWAAWRREKRNVCGGEDGKTMGGWSMAHIDLQDDGLVRMWDAGVPWCTYFLAFCSRDHERMSLRTTPQLISLTAGVGSGPPVSLVLRPGHSRAFEALVV